MNYFDHHIGDYDEATSHLSAREDGIYCRLLRKYYAKEKPLPTDVAQLQRWTRCRDDEDRQAVVAVLDEFFDLRGDGYHQKTCDEVLGAYRAGAPERKVKKANESNRADRHRLERSRLFEVLVASGLHASWNTGISELRALVEKTRSQTHPATALATVPVTAPVTTSNDPSTAPATPVTASHTQNPLTNTQEPKEEKEKKPTAEPWLTINELVGDGLSQGIAKAWLAHRKEKKARLTALAWSGFKTEVKKAGWDLDEAVRKAIARNWITFESDWVKSQALARGTPMDEAAIRAENARTTEEARRKVFGAGRQESIDA